MKPALVWSVVLLSVVPWYHLVGQPIPPLLGANATTAAIPSTQPHPTVFQVAKTNDTTTRTTYLSAPSVTTSSNVLYLIGVYAGNGGTIDCKAVTNTSGQIATKIGSTNYGSTISQLSLWRFSTNIDVALGQWCAGYAGGVLSMNMTVIAVSNLAVGTITSNSVESLVQTQMWSVSAGTVCSNLLPSLVNTSGSNIVAIVAGNISNPFGGSANASSEMVLSELYDIGINANLLGHWAGVAQTFPVLGQGYKITTAQSLGGATIGVELKALYQSVPYERGPPQDTTVAAPDAATFSIYVIGDNPISYQWSRNDLLGGWTNIPSATATSYTINPTALSDTLATFRCVYSNPYGSSTSSVATLTVTP